MARPRSRSPPSEDEGDTSATERLAQLEKLLAQNLGYGGEDEEMDEVEVEVSKKEKKHKKDKKGKGKEKVEEPVSIQEQVNGDAEVVSFKLFSSSAPVKVVLKEKEVLHSVPDRRIRAVEDEPKEVSKRRRKDIKSVSLSGSEVLSQSLLSTPSHSHDRRHTFRKIHTLPSSTATPTLAYLNHPNFAFIDIKSPLPVPPPATSSSTSTSKPSKLPAPRRTRLPILKSAPNKTLILSPLNFDKKSKKRQKEEEGRKREEKLGRIREVKMERKKNLKRTEGGVNRVSKRRRESLRKRMGVANGSG